MLDHEPAELAGGESLPLVGRDRERARLAECLDAALAGRGRLVLIGGEAGIGKTALAEALGQQAARGLLAVAAVIGQEAPPALWAAVAGVDEQTLLEVVERAVEAHLLEETPGGAGVRFVHALIREALYEGLVAPRRQVWHRRVAEALVAAGSGDLDAVAYHFRQAGDTRAVEWLVRAGDRAQRAYAWLTAAARFEAALALMPGDGAAAQERGWLLARLAWLLRYADPQRSVAYLGEAIDLATVAADHVLEACATFYRGLFRYYAGDIRQGLDAMAAGLAALNALALADRAPLRPLAGVLLEVLEESNGQGVLAWVLALAGRYAEAHTLGSQVVAQMPARPPYELGGSSYGDACQGLGIVHAALGRPAEARRAFAHAREAYQAVEHHFQLGIVAVLELNEVALPYLADQPALRRLPAEEGEQAWTRAQGVWADFLPSLARLPLQVLEGTWDEARAVALASAAPGGVVSRRSFATRVLGPLAYYQGNTDLAWCQVRAVLPDGPETEPGNTWLLPALAVQRLAAALAVDAGDLVTARAWLAAHDRWLAWSGAVPGQAEGRLGWAAYHRAAGDLALARSCATTALRLATEPRQPLALLAAHRLLGQLDTMAGHYREAGAHLDTALKLAEACAAPYERALTLLAVAELRQATGDRAAACALVDEVRTIAAPLGARPLLARAEALAARVVTGPAAAPAYPAGLTAREVEVLRLVAAGLSNAEAAARLALSPRTVEQHLRSVYNKLGVASRSAATRFAIEHGLA